MYVLVAALRALRRAMLVAPVLARSILEVACQATGAPHTVIGPGAALKALLTRNKWSLTAQGTLVSPTHLRIDLASISSKAIGKAVQKSWMFQVRESLLHRNGLHRCGVPLLTAKTLSAYAVSEQKILARHITGAFQAAATKHKWGAVASECCPWCGEVETRWHRFVTCPAFSSIRAKHADTGKVLEQSFPAWVYAPFAVLPEPKDILSLVFQTRKHPLMPRHLHSHNSGPSALCYYTDGTCANPTIPYATHAA